eukprot:GHVR01048278.1.p1 GENE.GHVR01048278.1~~GHVR01048278.1.p1  ORF type:complete len:372 (-),score=104.01 GHVR01048278.1:56-1171(-)
MYNDEFKDIFREAFEQSFEEGDFAQVWSSNENEKTYTFALNNQYLLHSSPLDLAKSLRSEGRDKDAIIALEAHLQKDGHSSEGWRLLGETYADMDMDVPAICCLTRAYECDKYNNSATLSLASSLTNEKESAQAMIYFIKWIQNHEEFCQIPGANNTISNINNIKENVEMLLREAVKLNPKDTNARIALGTLLHITGNYLGAVDEFSEAVLQRPMDPCLWNKLGATLANSGRREAALPAYHHALSIKPNFVRCWCNLAIAKQSLGETAECVRLSLQAVRLNPDAVHLWHNLEESIERSAGDRLSTHTHTLTHTHTHTHRDLLDAVTQKNLEKVVKMIDSTMSLEDIMRVCVSVPSPHVTLKQTRLNMHTTS